jgi:signal peptidase II
MAPKWIAFLIALIAAVGLDQGTKLWARHALAPRSRSHPMEVIAGHVELEYAENRGAAFSSLQGGGARWPLAAAALVGLVVVVVATRRCDPDQVGLATALGLIGGGAVGNGIDRAATGRVVDWVLLRWGAWRWPDFNVADAALVVGLAVLLLAGSKKRPRAPALSPAARR